MATRTLAIKYSSEGFTEAVRSLNSVGVAFDDALSKAQDSVKEAIAASEEAEKAKEKASKRATQAINNAYRELGVKASADVERLKAQAISAFEALKASGVASAQDIANAEIALNKRLAELNKQLGQTEDSLRDAGQQGGFFRQIMANLIADLASNALQNFFGGIVASVSQLKNAVFSAGITTENLKAQLKTLEGSTEAAQKAYEKIAKFAKETPFELQEVTQAYISLSNRGLKPTEVELRKIGDLAGSQAKPLQQYVEAILDAMTGENERLKEFGIKASQSGDKVSFTFKGITKTVEKTEDAIYKALLSFSEMDGVLGGMNERAKTTEGQLSNVTDSLKAIYVNLFEAIKPAIDAVVSSLVKILDPVGQQKELFKGINLEAAAFQKWLEGQPQLAKDLSEQFSKGVKTALTQVAAAAKQLLEFLQKNPTAIQQTIESMGSLIVVMGKFLELVNATVKGWGAIADTVRLVGQELSINKDLSPGDVRQEILKAGGTEKDADRVLKAIQEEVNKGSLSDRFFNVAKTQQIVRNLLEAELTRLQGRTETNRASDAGLINISNRTKGYQSQFSEEDFKENKFITYPVKGGKITGDQGDQHRGVDIFAPVGTPVVSPFKGTIVYAQAGGTVNKEDSDPSKPGYQAQHSIKIRLDTPIVIDGKRIEYAYLTHLSTLEENIANQVGKKIEAGQKLGTVGMAGGAPHLHLGLSPDESFKGRSPYSNRETLKALTALKIGTAQVTPETENFAVNYARLNELNTTLEKNKTFAGDITARMTALIIAAGESGPANLKQGATSDLFNFRGGANNQMRGFAQFNTKYFDSQTSTQENYTNFLAAILTGRINLPTGRGRFDPRDLEKKIKEGVIATENQLLDYLQKTIPIIDWHGLHESGGGGARIRESGVLKFALAQIKGAPTDFAQEAKEADQIVARAEKRADERKRQEREFARQRLEIQQKDDLLNFDKETQGLAPNLRDRRALDRQVLIRKQEYDRQALIFDQTIEQLKEERAQKLADIRAGKEVPERDFSGEITLLEQRKRQLRESYDLETKITQENEAQKLAQEAKQRSSERARQEQELAQKNLSDRQQNALLQFDQEVVTLPDGGIKDARAIQREALVKKFELERQQLEIQQAIANLKEERQRKIAGELSTGRDITAEINLLERRNKALEDAFSLQGQIVDIGNEAAIKQRVESITKEIEAIEKVFTQTEIQLRADSEAAAIASIEEQYKEYKKQIDDTAKALSALIEFKQALGVSTEQEINQLETLKQQYLTLENLQGVEIGKTLTALDFGQRQKDLDQQTAIASIDSRLAQAKAGQLQQQGDQFGANDILRNDAVRQENLRYQQELLELEATYQDQPALLEDLKQKALQLNEINLSGINSQFQTLGETVGSVVANGFVGLFDDLVSGTKSTGEAFQQMAKQVLSALSRILIQMLVVKAASSLFGGGGGVAVRAGFATGGLVSGEGTSTSDSIPAMLSNGEYVVKADAVSHYGVAFLEALNSAALPVIKAAQGGIIGLSRGIASPPTSFSFPSSSSPNQGGNRTININQTIVTPDADSFRRSEFQRDKDLAEQARRAMLRG